MANRLMKDRRYRNEILKAIEKLAIDQGKDLNEVVALAIETLEGEISCVRD